MLSVSQQNYKFQLNTDKCNDVHYLFQSEMTNSNSTRVTVTPLSVPQRDDEGAARHGAAGEAAADQSQVQETGGRESQRPAQDPARRHHQTHGGERERTAREPERDQDVRGPEVQCRRPAADAGQVLRHVHVQAWRRVRSAAGAGVRA